MTKEYDPYIYLFILPAVLLLGFLTASCCYHGFWLPCRQGNFPPKVNKRQRARVIEIEAPPPRPCRIFTDSMFDIDLSLREESERISNNQSDDGTAYSNESNENLSYKSLLTLYNTDTFKELPTSLCNLRQVKSLSELYIIKDAYQ